MSDWHYRDGLHLDRERERVEWEEHLIRKQNQPQRQFHIPSPTGKILLIFIGGPLHMTERVQDAALFREEIHSFLIDQPMRELKDLNFGTNAITCETYDYRLAPLNPKGTEFSTHPIVIAVFVSS